MSKNKCELKTFKNCAVYSRVIPFWIYITINFFKILFPLPVCIKILSILKKKKNYIEKYNPFETQFYNLIS